ncbi:MAG TPA: hypothetical protein ENH29_07275 [Bacteroidetes bacterium]|nr:hypothetical protein [Bacteroidota bacterium]
MKTIRVQQIVAKDSEILVKEIPYRKGQKVEVIVLPQTKKTRSRPHLTVRRLRQFGLIGLWKDRDDIQNSADYTRHLREQAQNRGM